MNHHKYLKQKYYSTNIIFKQIHLVIFMFFPLKRSQLHKCKLHIASVWLLIFLVSKQPLGNPCDVAAGVALALKFTGSRKIFADPFKSTKNNF